jgi:ElaB/YqjD/DUF883 family membrane-anchored ribosome-binding protein
MATKAVAVATRPRATDPSALRAEIAHTRDQLGATLDELHGRLDPVALKEQAIEQFHEAAATVKAELKAHFAAAKQSLKAELERELDAVKERLSSQVASARTAVRAATIGKVENMMQGAGRRARQVGTSVTETIRDNPIPAALAGLGLAWLLVEGLRRRAADDDVDVDVDIEELDDALDDGERGPSRGRRALRSARDAAQRAGRTATSGARRVRRRTGELVRDNPLAAAAAAAAAGVAVGLALPRTVLEDTHLGPARDRVVEKVHELAHAGVEKASDVVDLARNAAAKVTNQDDDDAPERPARRSPANGRTPRTA